MTLLYLHIPKTAGTSMKAVLREAYGAERVRAFSGKPEAYDELRRMGEADWAGIDVLAGHFFYGVHRFVPGACRYVTMLRDPVERVLSHYWYVRGDASHRDHAASMRGSPAEFVKSGVSTEVNDMQVRMLAGLAFGKRGFGEVTEEMLEAAIGRVREFAGVGVVERFEASVGAFGRALGWSVEGRARLRETARGVVTEEDRAEIRAWNGLDVRLYEAVVGWLDGAGGGERQPL